MKKFSKFFFLRAMVFLLLTSHANTFAQNLEVTDEQSLSGNFDNLTIKDGGVVTLTSELVVDESLVIETGGVLDMGMQTVSGTASFTMQTNSTLIFGTSIASSLTLTGTKTWGNDANFVLNGTELQTLSGFPSVIRSLTLDNPSGMYLNAPLEVGVSVTVNQGRFNLNNQQLRVRNYDNHHIVFINNSAADHNFKLRFQKNNQIFEVQGTEILNLNDVDSQRDKCKILMNNHVNLKGDQRLEKGSHFELNGYNLMLRPDYNGFGTYGLNNYFLANNGGAIVQNLTSTTQDYTYNMVTPNMESSIWGLGDDIHVNVGFSASAVGANASFKMTLVEGTHPEAVGAITMDYLNRYIDFEFTDVTDPMVSLEFIYMDEDVVGEESAYETFFYNGTEWLPMDGLLVNSGNSVSVTGINGDGAVTLGRFLGMDVIPCPKPDNLSVSNIAFTSALLGWDVWAPEAIGDYLLQYREVGATEWIAVESVSESSYQLSGLTDNTSYEWRVSSGCTNEDFTDESQFSEIATFDTQVDNGCMAPVGLQIETLSSGSAVISWSPVPDVTEYVVEYKLDQEAVWTEVPVDGALSQVALPVVDEKRYQVRIKTVCSAAESLVFSETLDFLSFIEGYDVETNSLFISSERNVPTSINFSNIFVQFGGKATLIANLSVDDKVVVEAGGILFCQNFNIQGNVFTLEDDGYLGIGSPQGITMTDDAGNIRTIVRNFSSKGIYEYNGTADQEKGDALNNYSKLIVSSGHMLYLGDRPSLGSYLLITSGYLKTDSRCYLYGNTVIENNAGPDAIAQLANIQTANDNIVITIKGTSPTQIDLYVDKQAVFQIYTDLIIDSFTSYNSQRGVVYMHGADLIFSPSSLTSFSVDQVHFDSNSRFVQMVDETFVGSENVYDRFYDPEGNMSEFRFTLNSLDAIDSNSAFTFKSVPRSHPERGGALNFLERYLDVSTQNINAFTANVSMNYLASQVVGEEISMQAGYFTADAWSYDGTIFNQGGTQVIANGISSDGQLTAGFDFSLEAQACAAPEDLSSSDVDYQGALLSWLPVDNGVDIYRVSYRKTGESEWMFKESTGGSSLVLTDLDYDSEYEWQVQTLCVPGYYAESDVSELSTFQTEPLKACDTPQSLLTDDITASTAELTWDDVAGVTGYTLQYRAQGASAWNVVNAETAIVYETTALTPSTNYEWRVRSTCGAGYYENSDFTEIPEVFITTPPCDTATGLSTSDVFYYGATLNWTPNTQADNQTVSYALDGTADWSSITGLAGTENVLETGEVLSSELNYQWKVRTYCSNGGISPFTASSLFTTTEEPICNVAEDFSVNENTTSAELSWSSGSSTAAEQSWTVAFREKGEAEFVTEQVVGSQVTKTGLSEGTIYEWRVQTNCDGAGYPWEASEWSAIQEFSTWMTCNTVPTGLTAQVEGWCSADLNWDEIAGITNYELRYREKGNAEWIVKQLGSRNNSFFADGAPSTTYEWQVRTYCFGTETNSEWSEVSEFSTMPDDGLSCGAPTDNPYFTKYGFAPQWTDDLPWDTFVNLTDYDDGSGYWDAAMLSAMIDVYSKGGGVVYCPGGEYEFRNNLDVAPLVIIRGETPAVTDAQSADFAPPTRFVFPRYEPTFEGSGTDNTSAFKMITSGGTRSNTGLIYLDINRAGVKFNVDMVAKDGYSTPQPVGEKTNVILFGIRSNNVAAPDANVPSADQHAWQRWGYRFAVNLSAYVTENGIITNNRVNDLLENNVHPIADESFQMPGYKVLDGSDMIELEGHQAIFDYTKHYGIELNRGKAYRTYGTREAEPSLYGLGNEVNDNWLFTTGRVGIMASGDGLLISGNIKKDRSGKVAWVSPTGLKLVQNSATLENRGIDMSGENVTVKENYIEVYNDNLKNQGYLSVDGEGILIQECCGGSTVNNFVIEDNTIKGSNGYIGIYKMRDIDGLIIRNNDLTQALGQQSNHSIWVDADTNGGPYRADNVRIEGNKVNKKVALRAAAGACNTYIVNNSGTGTVVAPCNTVVANNPGLTYDGTPCPPEVGCDMPGAPEITSFDPEEGAEMYEVTLQGLYLDGTEKILVGSVEVTDYTVLDDNTVIFSIPTGAVTGKITIETNKGQWDGSSYVYPSVGVSDQDFVIGQGVEPLVLTPVPGYYDEAVTLTITSDTDGTVIYYTLDGTEPSESSLVYDSGVEISETSELRARGYKSGLYPSIETSGLYMLQIIDADFSTGSTNMGEQIEFIAGVFLPFGEVAKVEWDFNNNGEFERSGMSVEYQFASEGVIPVRMKVTTDLGFTKEVVKNINIVATGVALIKSDLELELWPNPATDVVNVMIKGTNIGNRIRYFVTDMSGRLVQFNEADVTSGEGFAINVSGLSSGNYLVGLYVNDRLEVKQIVVK